MTECQAHLSLMPEILGVGEDISSAAKRRGGGPCASDILSVYLEGGPRYRLAGQTYEFQPPVAVLIPKGTLDADRQEGKVKGIFALFHGRGLVSDSGVSSEGEVTVTMEGVSRVVPCLKELSPADAAAIAATLRELAVVAGSELTSRLKRVALLLRAVSDYCASNSRTPGGGIHRAAARLHQLLNDLAFENIPMQRLYSRIDVSAAHAETLFHKAFGITPVAYRRQLRMQRARELLVSSSMNVSETAYSVGFADPLYFSKIFRGTYGVTPSSLIRDFSNARK